MSPKAQKVSLKLHFQCYHYFSNINLEISSSILQEKNIYLCFKLYVFLRFRDLLYSSWIQYRNTFIDYVFSSIYVFCYRERLLRFVCSLEDMECIAAPLQHTLLKKNLGNALMLSQVISFNIDSVEDEMKFIFSKACCQLNFRVTKKWRKCDFILNVPASTVYR